MDRHQDQHRVGAPLHQRSLDRPCSLWKESGQALSLVGAETEADLLLRRYTAQIGGEVREAPPEDRREEKNRPEHTQAHRASLLGKPS